VLVLVLRLFELEVLEVLEKLEELEELELLEVLEVLEVLESLKVEAAVEKAVLLLPLVDLQVAQVPRLEPQALH